MTDLRLGRWQDVLSDVTCDALIVDAPYSARTHHAHNKATGDRPDLAGRELNYSCWTYRDVDEFVESWHPRTRGWIVTITDHELAPAWIDALREAGRYVFSPLPLVEIGGRVRLLGDGPSSWTCWIVVARPRTREFMSWGALRGAYLSTERGKPVVGGKPVGAMREIVRDYSRPGDVVCDPCFGGGTTLLAAKLEGRRAIGSEMDPASHEIAKSRLCKFPTSATQASLFGEE